ncbi:MAG: hypothetical protein CW349_09585 [Firmicutes bacterium]|nr:hypothetical protein [Bacillota bacterium]
MRSRWIGMLGALFVALSVFASTSAAASSERAVVELWKALKPLTTVTSVMNTGAHPDDERSHLLAYFSLGVGARTISVIANRGEGGQNELGNEYVHALGVLRSQELAHAAEVLNMRLAILSQDLDDPIWDFGFSKSPEETLALWGEEYALERLIRAIRTHRPDVLYPSFDNVPSQHGHHRAINLLTVEAFSKAADPTVFPEHFEEGLHPWQPRKLYLPVGAEEGTVQVPVGAYDPIFGRTYAQLGEESRYVHKSQGMGQELPYGPRTESLKLLDAVVEVPEQETSVFDGLPFTVADLAAALPSDAAELAQLLHTVQAELDATVAAFPDFGAVTRQAHRALAAVRAALAAVAEAQLPEETRVDIEFRLQVKADQLARVSLVASQLKPEVIIDDPEVVRGQAFRVTLAVYNGGEVPLQDLGFALVAPDGWTVEPLAAPRTVTLRHGETAQVQFLVRVPETAAFFHPYANRYTLGRDDPFRAELTYRVNGIPVRQRILPQVPVAVLPDYSVATNPRNAMINTLVPGDQVEIQVSVRNYRPEPSSGVLRLRVPDGWQVDPVEVPFAFQRKGETFAATFTVTPPPDVADGDYTVVAEAVSDVATSELGVRVIDYPHISRTYLIEEAQVTLRAFPLAVAPVRVGYVASGFDSVPEALRLMGLEVTLLGPEELEFGDLSQYDTIVVGIYAYRYRPDLAANNARLLEWVRNGGNLIVLNHRYTDNWDEEATPPYPIRLGRPSIEWRVTDETAPVEVLEPDHVVMNWPNKITEADWSGWVKDRGFHFPMAWADEFVELFAMTDPGEEHRREELKGNTLWARVGEGTYLYSSLIWYFQLEQLVPGAYRMMANFVSQPLAPPELVNH